MHANTTDQKTLEFTDGNFEPEVLKNDDVVLVDFWASWCPPCRALAPTIDELARVFEGRAKVGKLDVDANPQIATNYNVTSIPTVLVFAGGQVKEQLTGLKTQAEYEAILDKHVG